MDLFEIFVYVAVCFMAYIIVFKLYTNLFPQKKREGGTGMEDKK